MEATEIRAEAIRINQERMRAHEAAKKLLDDTKGQFTAEQRSEWDRINADIDDLAKQRDVFVQAETRAREAGELREADSRLFGESAVDKAEKKEAADLRAFLTGRSNRGNSVDQESGRPVFEIDIRAAAHYSQLRRQGYDAAEARALAWDTGSIASGVPTTTANTLYQLLEASIAGFKMPTTKINTASGEDMKFPKVDAHGIATQVSGQGTTLAGTDPTFLSTTLGAYKYGELVIVANEVVADTSFDIVGFVMANIGRAVGRKIDVDLVVGTGSGQPNGMMTGISGSGTIATGGSLIDPSYEKLVDLVYSVNDEYRSSGNAAWLMRDKTAGVLRKLRDGAGGTIGAVLWQPSLTSGIQFGQPDTLLGFPVYTDPNVASIASNAKVLAFGDWNGYFIRTVGNVIVDSDTSRYFDTDQTGFRGRWRVDGDYVDTTAVNVVKVSV